MRHIVNPIRRHFLMPLLVVVQVAVACAIICNTLFLLQQRLAPILAADGVNDPGRLIVAWQIAAKGSPWPSSRLIGVEASLRALPGVTATSIAGSIPMEELVQMNGDVFADGGDGHANAAIYVGNHLLDTLQLKLVAGRKFESDEETTRYKKIGVNESGTAIITRALANRLFPDGALGRVIRIGNDSHAAQRVVVGVVEHLMRNQLDENNHQDIDYSMLFPGIPGNWPLPVFLVRVGDTSNVDQIRKLVRETIERDLKGEMAQGVDAHYETYAELRSNTLARSRAAVWLLAAVSAVVVVITLAGILGLSVYWVQQRAHQIGIRRALGARQIDILQWLQLENALVVGSGVVFGMLLAYLINIWLMGHYELPRLPAAYLPAGGTLLMLLGQMAVFWPARRASMVPPIVAIRAA